MRLGIGLLALAGCQLVFDVETEGVCPAEFGTERYVLFDDLKSWTEAQAACRDLDQVADGRFTHLAVLTDLDESLLFLPPAADASVGLLRDSPGGPWRWVTGEFPSEDPALWAPLRPNDNGGNCAARISTGKLDNVGCPVARPYICECDGFESGAN